MMTIIAMVLLAILGMPFFGIYLLIDKSQQANRGLGFAVLVVGLIIWMCLGIN